MMRVKQLAGAANTGTCGKRGLKEYCLLTTVDVQHHELEVNNQGTREEEHFTLHYDGDNEIPARPETAPGISFSSVYKKNIMVTISICNI
jgi:hypothetical protein